MIETVSDTPEGQHSTDCRNYQELPSAHALVIKGCQPCSSNDAGPRLTSMRIMGGKVIRTLTTVTPREMYGPRSGKDLESMLLL